MIAVVGGVGSGKSTISRELAKSRNVLVVDGDVTGHDALRESDIKDKIRQRFGDDIFDQEGNILRPQLGELVWGESEEKVKSRNDLESIVHPWIRAEFQRTIQAAKESKKYKAVILDAAVLLESGWDEICDAVVFVDTPLETRLQNVTQQRGWTEKQLREREESQLPLSRKKQLANYTIENYGAIRDAVSQFERILDQFYPPIS